MTDNKTIIAYKGFNKDLTCRGFQYEVGKTYEHQGPVIPCESGFHACEHPLDVFGYYEPAGNRFAIVEMSGETATHESDSKVAAAKITITAEVQLHEVIAAAVKYVFDRAKWLKSKAVSADQGAASATGDQGAASATGYRGAASATGYQGAASATGDRGAASATGYRGAASATGDQGAASATGYRGAAMGCGYKAKVSGKEGNALFLAERNERGEIINVWSGIVGRDDVRPDTWYSLRDGKLVEVK